MVKKLFRIVKSKFSMRLVQHGYFTDCVSGSIVSLYEDCYGVEYMSESKLGFRVKRSAQSKGE